MAAWICDVNGVLVDSTAVARAAFAATAARAGFRFTPDDFAIVKSLTLVAAYRLLDPAGNALARRQWHLAYVRERIGEIRPYPHVATMLASARARGVQVGAVTSYGETAEACLVNTGLYAYFDCLVTQEEVKRPKPHPDQLLRVLTLLAIDSRRADEDVVHVGDSPLDIEAGKTAAVRTVGVTYGVSNEAEIATAGPDHVIHSFQDMRLFLERPESVSVAGTCGG